MRKIGNVLTRSARGFASMNRILGSLAGIVLTLAWVLVLLNVLFRKTHIMVIGLIEIVEYLILLMTFMGAAFLLSQDGHVKMDLVIEHIKQKNRVLINIVTYSLASIAFSILAVASAILAWDHYQTGYFVVSPLNFPRAPLHAVVAAGSLLLSLQLTIMIRSYLNEFRSLHHKPNLDGGEKRWL